MTEFPLDFLSHRDRPLRLLWKKRPSIDSWNSTSLTRKQYCLPGRIVEINITIVAQMVKNMQGWRPGFDPWIGKIPWRKEWLPTLVSGLGEFHGQRSLEGYGPWGCKESDTTKRLSKNTILLEKKNKEPLRHQ